jgi:hypothetical protein
MPKKQHPQNGKQSLPGLMWLEAENCAVEIEQTAGDNGEPKPAKLTGLAYSGAAVRPSAWSKQVVTDIRGISLPKTLPILAGHVNDMEMVVGTGRPYKQDGQLFVEGTISRANKVGEVALQLAKDGVQLQLSIGSQILKHEIIEPGKSVSVNNQTFTAGADGLVVIRKSAVREISLTPVGADGATWSNIEQSFKRENNMPPENQEVETETTIEQNGQGSEQNGQGTTAPPPASTTLNQSANTQTPDPLADFRRQQAEEIRRVTAIRQSCGNHLDIVAEAIEQGWTPERAELQVYRALRPSGPTIQGGKSGGPSQPRVVEAALRLAGSENENVLMQEYGAETMEAAYPLRQMGLCGLIQACCDMEGASRPRIGASPVEIAQAGFSTGSLSTLLGNTAHKVLIASYRSVSSAARKIAKKLSASDFKTHTGVQLTGDPTLAKVGNTGQLQHASLGEASYTYAVDTYGKIFGITRQMIKNDDLGAFLDIPAMLGRGSALTIEKLFWTLVLANTNTFFGSGNNNYISGATTVLGITSLSQAVAKFRQQVDVDKNPILVEPKLLVVPPELETMAKQLSESGLIIVRGTTDNVLPSGNIHGGKYEPVVSPYLSNSNYTGNSSTAWYLFGDPADVAAFGIAYLDGVENPTIEDAPLQGDMLGKAWRGYIDFGVCQINHRGAVKSKGAA